MKPRRKNPTRRPNVPSDATGEDIRALAEGGYEDDYDYGDDVVMVFHHGDDTRMVRIVRGKWVVDTQRRATSSDRNPPTTHRPFPTRDRAFHYARRTGYTYEAMHGVPPTARRNPERSLSAAVSDAEIRRRVASEASTARGHHALALTHYRESEKFNVRGDYAKADYHGQMARAHESVARSLEGVSRAIAKRRR